MTEADEQTLVSVSERARKKLERDMGPVIIDALHDPKTVEIMLNADGNLWIERLGEEMKLLGTLRPAITARW